MEIRVSYDSRSEQAPVVTVVDVAPPPEPPPPPVALKHWRLPLNLADITCLRRHVTRGRYTRSQSAIVFTKTDILELFEHFDVAASGAARTLQYQRYTLEIDGVERASASPPWVSASVGRLVGAFGDEADGLYLAELYGWTGSTKTLLMHCGVYLDREGKCKDDPRVWRQTGSHGWAHGNPNADVILMSKADAKPVPRPLPERKSFVGFSAAVSKAKIARRMLVPGTFENDHDPVYPVVTKAGITVCEGMQGYDNNPLFEAHSRMPIVMGERNVARLPYPLLLKNRRGGGKIVCGNGYMAQVDSTGKAILLAGHCHKEAVYWQEPPTSVLDPRYIRVGRWDSSIPVEEQIFGIEPWGGGWVPRSVLVDPNAPKIDGEPPHLPYTTADGRHVNGPLWLQTDRRGGILAAQFDGSKQPGEAEPYIYWFLPPGTLQDGWGMAIHGNSMYVTERTGQRISEWDLDTRQKIRDVVSAPASSVGYIGTFPDRRFIFATGKTVADAQAFDICYPEGLDKFVDGDVWLYYTSSAMQQVNRVNTRTGVVERGHIKPWVGLWARGGVGDYFTTLAVSPGGFGPPGAVFLSTYVNAGRGKATAYTPDGKGWDYFNYWGGASNYPITQCVGDNHLTCVDADGWIDQFHLAEPDDKLPTAQWLPGLNAWTATGCSVKYGPNAVGMGSTPYVWGENPDRDVYARDFLGL